MAEARKMLVEEGEGYYEEKKSRFLAVAFCAESEAAAEERLRAIRKKYWDARHTVFAYVIGPNGEKCRYSDDGEPSGTAGKPVLDVILGSGAGNLCIAVTRYFGGVLLGTGGLVRAYSAAAAAALSRARLVRREEGYVWQVLSSYAAAGRIERLAREKGWLLREKSYESDVTFRFYLRGGEEEPFCRALADATGGEAFAEKCGPVSFAAEDGTVWEFDQR